MTDTKTATARKLIKAPAGRGGEISTATSVEAIAEREAMRGHGWRPAPPLPRLCGVRGPSGSGKTTLIEALIPTLMRRGVRVGTIKHAHHGATLDVPGKDSHRHANAGAACVLLLGPGQAGFFVPRDAEPDRDPWLEYFAGRVDLVLVEGYSRDPIPFVTIETVDGGVPRLQESMGDTGPCWTLQLPREESGEISLPAPLVEQLAGAVFARLCCR